MELDPTRVSSFDVHTLTYLFFVPVPFFLEIGTARIPLRGQAFEGEQQQQR